MPKAATPLINCMITCRKTCVNEALRKGCFCMLRKAGDSMDFYLTAPDGGRIHFPMNPERVTAQTGAKMQTFEVIALGDITLPRGSIPARFLWDGILPGELRKDAVYVKSWRSPKEILGILSAWRNNGEKLRLLVTETPINHDVYIDTLEHTWSGGHGDAQYSITLVQARELIISTDTELKAKQAGTQEAAQRPAPPTPKTYTVKSGDTLYAIAKQVLRDGTRWKEIYNANTGVIGKNPNVIYPGQVFRIP